MKPHPPYWYEVQQALVLMGWACWIAPPWQELLASTPVSHGGIDMGALFAPYPLALWSVGGLAIAIYRVVSGVALANTHRAAAAALSFTFWFIVAGCLLAREPLSTGFPTYAGLALMSAASLWGLRRIAP